MMASLPNRAAVLGLEDLTFLGAIIVKAPSKTAVLIEPLNNLCGSLLLLLLLLMDLRVHRLCPSRWPTQPRPCNQLTSRQSVDEALGS